MFFTAASQKIYIKIYIYFRLTVFMDALWSVILTTSCIINNIAELLKSWCNNVEIVTFSCPTKTLKLKRSSRHSGVRMNNVAFSTNIFSRDLGCVGVWSFACSLRTYSCFRYSLSTSSHSLKSWMMSSLLIVTAEVKVCFMRRCLQWTRDLSTMFPAFCLMTAEIQYWRFSPILTKQNEREKLKWMCFSTLRKSELNQLRHHFAFKAEENME